MSKMRSEWGRLVAGAFAAGAMTIAGGCDEGGDGVGEAPLLPIEEARSSDGVRTSAVIQGVAAAQVERDGVRILTFLEDESGPIRRRAALAAASVQDERAVPRLLDLLNDPDAEVRADAAFALGQMELPDGGARLLDALASEEEGPVRVWLLEALGKRGGEEALAELAAATVQEADEAAQALALSRGLIRGVGGGAVAERLVVLLVHPDSDVREAAAYGFGRTPEVAQWGDHIEAIRSALDGMVPGGLAELYLVQALGRFGAVEDLPRLLPRITAPDDWRVRVAAAQALGADGFRSAGSAVDALMMALDDRSEHVAVAAANGLARGDEDRESILSRIIERIVPDPERWHWMVPFLLPLAESDEGERVLFWTREMVRMNATAAMHGVRALGRAGVLDAEELLFELTGSAEPALQAAAVDGLGALWPLRRPEWEEEGREQAWERYGVLFATMAHQAPAAAAIRGARHLSGADFALLRNSLVIEEALAVRIPDGEIHLIRGLAQIVGEMGDRRREPQLRAMLGNSDYRVRMAGAAALQSMTGEEVPEDEVRPRDPERTIDWRFLYEVGRFPRLRIETTKGEMVLVLDTEQAPLTVQSIAEQANLGMHDGVRFHRVLPNFVIQAGDVIVGDGSGGPGYRIRSEFTRIPFTRGVIGMASGGKDTEGSQWFITHSPQPHLDGQYTAFGWLVSGGDVLDRIMEGDVVIRMTIEPDQDEVAQF